ncbi:hypothetical protein [Methylobacterium sp. Gmos1]
MSDIEDIAAELSVPVKRTAGRPRSERPLEVRTGIRMTQELHDAVVAAARRDGITVGAWIRAQLAAQCNIGAEAGRRNQPPLPSPPREETVAIAAAVRELASVNAAIALSDTRAAKAGLERSRALLIPILMKHSRR